MKVIAYKKVRTWLLSSLVVLAIALCALMGLHFSKPVNTQAEEVTVNRTLESGEFQTNGASVRVFMKDADGNLNKTDRQGIRFHVEMGSGHKHGTQVLFDETTKNERGSLQIADNYKTYTLILPTRLLQGDLTVNSGSVMKLDTTDYWYKDSDGNVESVAYIYNVPSNRYTDNFSYRGIICQVAADGTETVVESTAVAERSLTYVAKNAYVATINPDTVTWGTEENPLDDEAADMIKVFVPTYTINYVVNGVTTSEEVLWGDTPQSVPSFTVTENEHIEYTASWYDETNKEEIDVTAAMTWTEGKEITLVQASATGFILTGVEDYNNFAAPDGNTYSGVKLYATLPTTDFFTADQIKSGTSEMVSVSASKDSVSYEGTGSFGGLQGAWALLEGKGEGAQMRLVLAFDSSTMKDGDELILNQDAAFYANNIMYTLSESFMVDYSVVNNVEDYGIFLGYLHNSDIKKIEGWDEYGDGTRVRIRITFYDDLLINSDFEFVFDGELPAGYEYPVYTVCNNTGVKTEITEGYYYWNEGANTILEMKGYEEHEKDELYGAPGVKIVQNGGYYIFEDAMYAARLLDGAWVVGDEKGTFGANAFEVKGWHADDTTETRFTTNSNTVLTAGGTIDRWFDDVYQVNVENMSETEEYAVYATKPDGTVTPITAFVYHGQDHSDGVNYNHIFALKNYEGTVAGETVTIIQGTRFWHGNDYYTASEDIVFYYNGTAWIVGNNGTADQEITVDDFTGKNYNYLEGGINKMRMHLTAETFKGATGPLYVESGSVKVNGKAYTDLYYHGNGNMIFEILGDSLAPIGQEAFTDTLVIEAGTRIWIGMNSGATAAPYCIEFTETIEWRYIGGGMTDGGGNPLKYEWVIPNNTNITLDDVTSMYNATDAGGEVRLVLKSGILTNSFYGFMAVDTSKGIPVVNGVEKANYSFAYGMSNNLVAVRGGEYGTKLGDYIVIPAGSVWWTTQGSLTFVDEIRGIWNPSEGENGVWNCGFNTENYVGDLTADNVKLVSNYDSEEIRLRIPRGISDTYYGPLAIDGTVTLEKASGTTVSSVFGYWYSGTGYNTDHTLIGLRATGFAGSANGDVLTIKKDTKLIFRTSSGIEGYRVFTEDVVYTYQNGAWMSAAGWSVTFSLSNATATLADGTTIANGETLSMYPGSHKITVTANDGYSITNVSNATNNYDGTYTVTVSTNMNVSVTTQQSIKMAADVISSINVYAEGSLTGVRINLNEDAYTALKQTSGGNYGVSLNGQTTVTSGLAASQFYAQSAYSYFGAEHGSLLELRFDTANLVPGDRFVIKAGSVFFHANVSYALEFMEDIVGQWTGTAWVLNPTKLGDLDWNKVGNVMSYSDFNEGGSAINYTIRIFLTEELFNGGTYQGVADNTVTINGTTYTGIWRYHGNGNKIIEISEWSYASGDVLVIEKGTKIYMGSSYYETTNTLTATCQANGSGAQWTWTVS